MKGPDKELSERLGLCADCRYTRQITSDRGSTFFQCQLAAVDATYPKYPRLPVWRCAGYEKTNAKKEE